MQLSEAEAEAEAVVVVVVVVDGDLSEGERSRAVIFGLFVYSIGDDWNTDSSFGF
jgi:hypothetical protein